MNVLFREEKELNPSVKAEKVLDFVLHEESEAVIEEKEASAPVKEELDSSPLLETRSERTKSRILFISKDLSLLTEGSFSQERIKSIAPAFEEVHIMVLTSVYQAKKGAVRLSENCWLYSTSSRYTFSHLFSAFSLAKNQLQFADGFRPDIVIALDPFLSGFVGMEIARHYEREFQVHVLEDYFFTKKPENKNTWLEKKLARFVLRRTQSIRTKTEVQKQALLRCCTHTKDIAVLPKYMNLEGLIKGAKNTEEKDLYPQFSFVILYVGALDYQSTLFRALDASRSALFSKCIALVVLGDGPAKEEFVKRADLLGIKEQVIFQRSDVSLPSHLHSADILLCTDTTPESDELVIQASASGLPLLIAENEFRRDLFEDGVDAFLCPPEDTICFSQKLIKFLNANALRTQFADNARDVVTKRLSEDPETYKLAYRHSIEGVFEHTKKA